MTLYRDMTPPELVETALGWHGANRATSRIVYALAKRLEQEYERAERHKNKTIQQAGRLEHLAYTLDTKSRPPAGYIKVAKPHIQQVFTVPENKGMWRCTGPFGTVQYGGTPQAAYQAWRRVMEQGHGIPRYHTRNHKENLI